MLLAPAAARYQEGRRLTETEPVSRRQNAQTREEPSKDHVQPGKTSPQFTAEIVQLRFNDSLVFLKNLLPFEAHTCFITLIFCRFGACCVFILDSKDSTTINYNDTYIQNPGYPNTFSDTTSLSYTINKCDTGSYE